MGYFKTDTLSGGRWKSVSRARPCPVCGGASWCQVLDGERVMCRRSVTGQSRTDRRGVPYSVHSLVLGSTPAPAPRFDRPTMNRARAEVRDVAYRAVLDGCALEAHHRAELEQRGLDANAIARAGYATLAVRGRKNLALAAIAAAGGEAQALEVPGVVMKSNGTGAWPSFAGCAGLAIPVRDIEGRIVALKIRRDEGRPKYSAVSSSGAGGPSAEHAAHVPVFDADRSRLVLTEGELKADASTLFCARAGEIASWMRAVGGAPNAARLLALLEGRLVVSAPGVDGWTAAFDVVRQLRAIDVVVAFDSDVTKNRQVAAAEGELLAALRREGVRAVRATWPAQFKGLDDYLGAAMRAFEGRAIRQ